MKFDCAMAHGPLGCVTDDNGKKTCTCDTDLCNIGKFPAASTPLVAITTVPES